MSATTRGGLIGRLSDEFELAWRESPPASIEEYYRVTLAQEASVLNDSNRIALLEELIKLDLEFRWRTGGIPRVQWRVRDYVQKFVELREPSWNSVQLLCEEFRVRSQWGDRPSRQNFVIDYPHYETHLTPLLQEIEKSLHGSISTQPPSSQTRSHIPAVATPTELPSKDAPKAPTPVDAKPKPSATSKIAPIFGYEIQGELGRGGMGVVYQAWDPGLKRTLALKLILSGAHASADEMLRFRKEAQAIAKLKHPNIVQIFQFGEHESKPCFALEFVDGGSLSGYLRGTPQPPEFAAELIETLARAMNFAHEEGIVHRDLKPANVLLDIDQAGKGAPLLARSLSASQLRPKITDFGLVKLLDEASDETHNGAVMGTPSYMAPEQAEGRNQDVGPAADTYALGAMLYEMLIGRPPFKGTSVQQTLDLVRHRDPVSLRLLQPSLPLDLETICLKCLRKNPEQRYASANDLADDLKRYRNGQPILARPVGSVEQAWKFYRRNPRVVYAGFGMLLLLLLALTATGIAAVSSASKAKAVSAQSKAENDKLTAERDKAEAGERALKDKFEAKQKIDEQGMEIVNKGVVIVEKEKTIGVQEVTINFKEGGLTIGVSERELSSPRGDVALAEKNLDKLRDTKRFGELGWEWHYLIRQCNGPRKPLTGHDGGLWSVAFNPKHDEIATASIDGLVKLWDVKTGKLSSDFTKHKVDTSNVASQAALNDAVLGTGIGDLLNKVGGVPVPKKVGEVPKHISPVMRVAYSDDGNYVASGALYLNINDPNQRDPSKAKGSVMVWDRKTQKLVGEAFQGHRVLVTALAFHPNGKQIASAGMDDENALLIWDIGTNAVRHTLTGHKGWISQARFSKDGKYLATGSSDGTAILWDLAGAKPTIKYVFTDHYATVHDLSFSKDGQFLATAGMDGSVLVWNLNKLPDPNKALAERDLDTRPVVLRGHIGSALGVAFSPDGTRVASGGFDRTVRVWDPKTGIEKITLRGHTECVWSVAFSPDGLKIASASFDGNARIWDASPIKDDSFPGSFTVENGAGSDLEKAEDHRINRLVFSPDGKHLATAGWDRTARLRDPNDGKLVHTLEHKGPVWGVAFSPNSDRVVTGSWDMTVRMWDANTGVEDKIKNPKPGENDHKFQGLKSPVQSVAYSPNGRFVAAGGWDGKVMVWDANTGAESTFKPKGHFLPVFSMAFSPDNKYLATTSGDRSAKLWPLAGGESITLGGHSATVYTVAFDKTGTRIALASWDKTVTVWTFDRGRAEKVLTLKSPDEEKEQADYMNGVAFSPDGQRIATVSSDKTLRCWDAKSGALLGQRTLRGVVWDVAYHPVDHRIVTAIWNPKCWVKTYPKNP